MLGETFLGTMPIFNSSPCHITSSHYTYLMVFSLSNFTFVASLNIEYLMKLKK